MNVQTMNGRTQEKDTTAGAPPRRSINWFRFWMQMLVAMLVFNVIAGFVTWYFIFPRLHPGM